MFSVTINQGLVSFWIFLRFFLSKRFKKVQNFWIYQPLINYCRTNIVWQHCPPDHEIYLEERAEVFLCGGGGGGGRFVGRWRDEDVDGDPSFLGVGGVAAMTVMALASVMLEAVLSVLTDLLELLRDWGVEEEEGVPPCVAEGLVACPKLPKGGSSLLPRAFPQLNSLLNPMGKSGEVGSPPMPW
jgi:hypothetical protein